MKHNPMARVRASLVGASLVVASLIGAALPVVSTYAATAVTGITATWNTSTSNIDVSWTGTGVTGDKYAVDVRRQGGTTDYQAAGSSGLLTGLTTTSASITQYVDPGSGYLNFVPGDVWQVNIVTTSSDSTTAEALGPDVTIGASSKTKSPQNVSVVYNTSENGFDVNGTLGDPTNDWSNIMIRVHGSTTWEYVAYGTPPALATGLTSLPDPDITGITPGGSGSTISTLSKGTAYDLSVGESGPNASPTPVIVNDVMFGTTSTGSSSGSTSTGAKTPDDGFTLNLANPIVVVAVGVTAAAVLLVLSRAKVRATRR